jgi:diguanylate cyclase (GGDEF)-like protein
MLRIFLALGLLANGAALAKIGLGGSKAPSVPLVMGLLGFNILALIAALCLRRTQPRPAEAARSEEQWEYWPLALARMDQRGRLHAFNRAFASLFALGPGASATLAQLTHPSEQEANAELLSQMASGRAREGAEERRSFRADGSEFQSRWAWRFQAGDGGSTAQHALVAVDDISRLRDSESALEQSRASLRDLYSVVAGHDLGAQIAALLDLGRRRFNVETAFLGQNNESKLKIAEVRSEDERIRRGQVYDVSTAKREGRLLRPQGPRGLLHADFEEGSVELTQGAFHCEGETYLGAAVQVDGKVWGTLNFSDPEGRPEIATDDREFLGLMSGWLSGELERRQARELLEKQQLELVRAAAQLEALAVHDALTGVKNRRAFDEQLESEWQRARRYNTPLSLLLLDVDKFKPFNDTYGHPAGDEVLKSVARVLSDSIRNIDFLARYGGEEFVLLLPSTDAEGAVIVADRLRERIASQHWPLRAVTASFGAATLSRSMTSPSDLLKTADEALYASKESGRNRVTHANALVSAPSD